MALPKHFWLIYVLSLLCFVALMFVAYDFINRPEPPTNTRAIAH